MSQRAPHAATPRQRRLTLLVLAAISAGASACFMAGYDRLTPSDGGMDGAPPHQTLPAPEAGSPGDPDAGDVMSSMDAGSVDGAAAEDADVPDAKAMPDAAAMDGGGMDASDAMPDARVDAGDASNDARMPDGSGPDATPPDAMPSDAASDAGPDAMPSDASDAGPCAIDAGCVPQIQTCAAGAMCPYVCDAGAYCIFNCQASTSCDVTCQAASRCEVKSRAVNPMDVVRCLGSAACIHDCDGGTSNCGFSACEGTFLTCGGEDVRCGWGSCL